MSEEKKKVIKKIKAEGMDGFEDIADMAEPISKSQRERNIDNFDLFNFLEYEYDRLEKLSVFFSHKLNNLKKYPQTEKLIERQTKLRDKLKVDVLQRICPSNSIFTQHLEQIFDKSFANNNTNPEE